jgi:hypothetical protein
MTTHTESVPRTRAGRSQSDGPLFLHVAPYVALLGYGLILLIPGVLPAGTCDGAGANHDAVLGAVGAASATITVLFLISAAVAHCQHRAPAPDRAVAKIAAGLAACFALAVALALVGVGEPVIYLMVLLIFALPITALLCLVIGAATVVGLVRDASRGWYAAIEGTAWVCSFVVLPVVTALAYLHVAPLCFG